MKPLVSVIVPVYNVGKYLKKCLSSIINQTLKEIEIILVNDGSTDNSGEIINEYAKIDSRIKVIYKENGGQSSARNRGLDIAKGKYIGFIDSDDHIALDMYEVLYNESENASSDIGVCEREFYLENGILQRKLNVINEEFNFIDESLVEYIVNKLYYKHNLIVCNKIYKRETIEKYNIRFKDVSYVGSEDMLFNYEVLLHSNKLIATNKTSYKTLVREGSTARSYKAGYMLRTVNLIKCMEKTSVDDKSRKVSDKIIPITFLFFYQWNVSQIKTYSSENINDLIIEEFKIVYKHCEFKKYSKKLVLDSSISKYMINMGFGTTGKMLIKIIMILINMRLYGLATKLILFK